MTFRKVRIPIPKAIATRTESAANRRSGCQPDQTKGKLENIISQYPQVRLQASPYQRNPARGRYGYIHVMLDRQDVVMNLEEAGGSINVISKV